jgi:hypothetical protein
VTTNGQSKKRKIKKLKASDKIKVRITEEGNIRPEKEAASTGQERGTRQVGRGE